MQAIQASKWCLAVGTLCVDRLGLANDVATIIPELTGVVESSTKLGDLFGLAFDQLANGLSGEVDDLAHLVALQAF